MSGKAAHSPVGSLARPRDFSQTPYGPTKAGDTGTVVTCEIRE